MSKKFFSNIISYLTSSKKQLNDDKKTPHQHEVVDDNLSEEDQKKLDKLMLANELTYKYKVVNEYVTELKNSYDRREKARLKKDKKTIETEDRNLEEGFLDFEHIETEINELIKKMQDPPPQGSDSIEKVKELAKKNKEWRSKWIQGNGAGAGNELTSLKDESSLL